MMNCEQLVINGKESIGKRRNVIFRVVLTQSTVVASEAKKGISRYASSGFPEFANSFSNFSVCESAISRYLVPRIDEPLDKMLLSAIRN
jgi:hypothetical protein